MKAKQDLPKEAKHFLYIQGKNKGTKNNEASYLIWFKIKDETVPKIT